ncbi:MAG: hypothetical protein SXV54_08295 [Chloroflexota bacterium]|nr:hypothetical protein [Chloroflexota bacterium]
MLDDKSRVTLFWFTIGMIIVVAIVAIITLLQACGRPMTEESHLVINPSEISLCLGGQHQFTVEGNVADDAEITWKATGGTIGESGLFTAGDEPGNYTITAIRSKPRQITDAVVHVGACTPTPFPTPLPSPTPTSIPTPTPTPTPEPTPSPADPQGDVGAYESGAPVEGVPAGVDIRIASAGADLKVNIQSTAEAPPELAGWAADGEVLLWITLYEPVPDPPIYTDWLFALDLDGDIATGRPAGSARINPDIGDEAVVGTLYDPNTGEYAPYFLVWDPAQGSWTDGPDVVRFTLSDSRTQVGLALPLEVLTQTLAQVSGLTIVPETVRGRAAVLSFVGEQAVVDFYPDRP